MTKTTVKAKVKISCSTRQEIQPYDSQM